MYAYYSVIKFLGLILSTLPEGIQALKNTVIKHIGIVKMLPVRVVSKGNFTMPISEA